MAYNGNKPHVLAVPTPGQGHVKPLMTLCRQIAKRGIKVTFVNVQSVHDRIVAAAKYEEEDIVLATVPDGLGPDEDPNNPFTLMEALPKTMPEALTDLIDKINRSNPDQRVSGVIADITIGWIFDIAEKMGAEPIGFSPFSLATLAMAFHIPKLLEEGTLDANGSFKKGGVNVISLSDGIPAYRKEELNWSVPGDPKMQKFIFDLVKVFDAYKAKWILCNSCYELEPAASELMPAIFPVGPLHLLHSDTCSAPTNFFSEDESCLSWLDNKPDGSVVYVSFGSMATFSQQEWDEIALGLPDRFLERVGDLGNIVEWVPQDKVLSHPSIGCFVTHCGWNSILEGVSRGVPFLCWPHLGDQFHNEAYIYDKWQNGLKTNIDKDGVRSRYEIKMKIDMVLSDDKFKANALKLKEMCGKSISDGGLSSMNLEKFIDHLWK